MRTSMPPRPVPGAARPKTRSRRTAALVGVVALAGAALLPFGGSAGAGHAEPPQSVYSGYAHGTTLHVDALTSGQTRALNVDVGLANAAVGSSGLTKAVNAYGRVIRPDLPAKHSHSLSRIAEVGLVSSPEADGQIRQFDARRDAPVSDKEEKVALNQTVSPAVHVNLARNAVHSRWSDESCILGAPIAIAEEHLARVEAVESGDDPTTPPDKGFDKPVVALDSVQLGPQRAATHTLSRQDLVASEAGTFALRSFVHTTLAPVTFLQGTPNEFTIEADGPAFLEVLASGRPGGARASYKAPILTVSRGSQILAQIPSAPVAVPIRGSGANDMIAEIEVNTMKPVAVDKGGIADKTVADDGTKAVAQAHVVQVRLLDLKSQNFTGATVSLGHMEAAAVVPAGGVRCPIPVTKSANPNSVSVGQSFVTTITVKNPFECELAAVRLQDDVSNLNPRTEQATNARFRVTESSPAADAPSLPTAGSLTQSTLVWNDIGTIAPGQSRSVAVTTLAQGAAGIISDIAGASGTLRNCPAGTASGQAAVSEPVRIDVAVTGRSPAVEVPTVQVLGLRVANEPLPSTGAHNAPLAGGALIAVATAGRWMALRRARMSGQDVSPPGSVPNHLA